MIADNDNLCARRSLCDLPHARWSVDVTGVLPAELGGISYNAYSTTFYGPTPRAALRAARGALAGRAATAALPVRIGRVLQRLGTYVVQEDRQ